MKRLPVYFLIDSSVSAIGEPAEICQKLVQNMIAQWRYDPYALKTLCISINTFNNTVKVLFPLTVIADLIDFESLNLQCSKNLL